MKEKLFIAGATGAIGRRLAPMLVAAGYEVYGATRRPGKLEQLRSQGVKGVLVDAFDASLLKSIVVEVRPDIIVHQLTDLPRDFDPSKMAAAVRNNARVRREGTANLVAAALAAGCARMVAQSIAWAYAPGQPPYGEEQPLDFAADGNRAVTVNGIAALEHAVLASPPMRGVVLRYGNLWGPGTSTDTPSGATPVHVDAAAHAVLLAVQHHAQGAFNIVDTNETVSARKAHADLGWSPSFRALLQ